MKKTILSIFFLIFFYLTCFTENQSKADSLLKLINDSKKEDTTKINLMLEYSFCFFPANPDSLEAINNRIIRLSEKINFPFGIVRGMNGLAMSKWISNDMEGARDIFLKALPVAEANKLIALQVMVGDNLGLLYHNQGDLDSAEYYYLRAIEAGKGKGIIKNYAKTFTDLAMNYRSKDNYVAAIHYQMEAKHYNAAAGDKKNEVANSIGLGNIFMGIHDFDKAISAYREAERLNDSLKDINFQLAICQNIGLLYVEINPDADSARHYLEMALKMALANNRMESYFTSLINLGNLEQKEKNFRLALEYYLKAYESPIFQRKNYERAAILVNLGSVYLKLKDLVRAEKFARQGLDLAHAGGYLEFEKTAFSVLAQIAAGKNDYRTAYMYQVQADTLRDSIWSNEVKSRIAEATYNVELKQAETENKLLQKDNEIKKRTIYTQWFIVGGVVLVLILAIILMVVVIRSSRRLKRLNQTLDLKNIQLEELNMTKDKFISIIAHDLKSPFNALLGLLSELDENYDDYNEKTKHEIIHNLNQTSHNTYNLLNNLLDWTQSQKGQLKYFPEEIKLKMVVEEVFSLLSTRAEMKKQTLARDFNEQMVMYADPQIIKGLLINLINNAIKFTPVGGTITVMADQDDEVFRIEIEDTGIGIPPEQISNLFRLDSGFNRKGTEKEPGTGLGLVMCQEYVNLAGGKVLVSSEEGKGSKFTVILPKRVGTAPGNQL